MNLILIFTLGYLIGAVSTLVLIGLMYASRSGEARAMEVVDSPA